VSYLCHSRGTFHVNGVDCDECAERERVWAIARVDHHRVAAVKRCEAARAALQALPSSAPFSTWVAAESAYQQARQAESDAFSSACARARVRVVIS
jgi:hypothetical protein